MKHDEPVLRIIAGRYKGKKLILPAKATTRSTKSIVRGSLFDTLGSDVYGEMFVEAFGGSGSIGLEALSRGAAKVYFVERDDESYAVLRKNIAALDPKGCEPMQGDAFERVPQIARMLASRHERAYFYMDPPFSIREGMEDIYDKTLAMIAALPVQSVIAVIIEHESTLLLPETIGSLIQAKQRKFGRTTLSYYLP